MTFQRSRRDLRVTMSRYSKGDLNQGGVSFKNITDKGISRLELASLTRSVAELDEHHENSDISAIE